MTTIEILGGDGIQNAFKELGINAKCTFHRDDDAAHDGALGYEVWEMSKSDYKKIENISDDDWNDDWGWWRFAKGSNMGTACSFFTVNGNEIIAWEGAKRESLRDDWDEEPDDEKKAYHYRYSEYENDIMPHEYKDLLEYFCEEIGASTEKNVCALAVDLAKANGMTMGQLFNKYME